MNTMHKQLFGVAAVAVLGVSLAQAQYVMTPISDVSGFYNANEVIGTLTPVTATMFQGISPQPNNDWAYYASGATGAPGVGLAMGTTFTSACDANTTFAFQSSSATYNALILMGPSYVNGANTASATLTLSGGQAYKELSFFGANAGGGNPTYPYFTINYQGGGTQSGYLTLYNMGNPGSGSMAYDPGQYFGISNGSGSSYGNLGSDFALCQMNIVTTDTTDPILSITLQGSDYGGGNYESFFGLSGAVVAVPEPSSLVLVGMGALTLFGCGRRFGAVRRA